jgi:hypothetical protein
MIDSDTIDARVQIKKFICLGEIEQAIKALNELNSEVSLYMCNLKDFGQKS